MINTKKNHTSGDLKGKVVILSSRKMDFLQNYMCSHLLFKRSINQTVNLQCGLKAFQPPTDTYLLPDSLTWHTELLFVSYWQHVSNVPSPTSTFIGEQGLNPAVWLQTPRHWPFYACGRMSRWASGAATVAMSNLWLGGLQAMLWTLFKEKGWVNNYAVYSFPRGPAFVSSHTETTWQSSDAEMQIQDDNVWGTLELPVGPGCFLLEKKHLPCCFGTDFTYSLKFQLAVISTSCPKLLGKTWVSPS